MKSPVPQWTDAKWRSWVISLLRRGTMRFPPRNEVLKEARTERKINKATGKLAWHSRCNKCKKEFPSSKIKADHIKPVVDVTTGFIDWNVYIERMYCVKKGWQAICDVCHDKKSAKERKTREKTSNNS